MDLGKWLRTLGLEQTLFIIPISVLDAPVPAAHGTAGQSKRVRKIMIVALARKLAIALWRFVELGLVPEAAILSPRVIAKAR